MELEGKTVFIMGGAQGIGAESAKRFVSEGAHVAAVDILAEKLSELERIGKGSVLGIEMDISQGIGIERAFDTAVAKFGGIDILLNCAVVRGNGPLDAIEEATVDLAFSVGVKSYLLGAQRAAKEMRKRGGGSIISMSSFYYRTPAKERVVYVTMKGAVEGLTRSLAVELAPDNIRVNAVAAGPVLTDRRRELGHGEPTKMAERYRKLPLGRFGNVEEIIETILFLATPRSSYVTGQSILVDGGITIA